MTASDMAVIPLEVVIGLLEASLARGSPPPPATDGLSAAASATAELTSAVPIPAPSTAKALARRLMV